MPRFNRERRVIEVLRSGRASLTIRTWDTAGVLAASRAFTEALELPAGIRWDSSPPDVDRWRYLLKEAHG
jgi:hypothetical protein